MYKNLHARISCFVCKKLQHSDNNSCTMNASRQKSSHLKYMSITSKQFVDNSLQIIYVFGHFVGSGFTGLC